MNYGVQLYSVRDCVKEQGMRETLRRVAEIGYKSVELAGYGDLTAAELRACADEFGLTVCGAHVGIKALLPDRIEQTVEEMKILGINELIIPAAKIKTEEQIREFLAQLEWALPRLREAGIDVGFHNHHTEYLPNDDGLYAMEILEKETDLFFELDTYWAFHAGIDPVAEMERKKDRLRVIHVKDGIPAAEGECGKPLGEGTAPVAAVYRKALELGLPMIVESETCTPDGMTEIRVCYDYLKSLE